jgi:hypothetical protein
VFGWLFTSFGVVFIAICVWFVVVFYGEYIPSRLTGPNNITSLQDGERKLGLNNQQDVSFQSLQSNIMTDYISGTHTILIPCLPSKPCLN